MTCFNGSGIEVNRNGTERRRVNNGKGGIPITKNGKRTAKENVIRAEFGKAKKKVDMEKWKVVERWSELI